MADSAVESPERKRRRRESDEEHQTTNEMNETRGTVSTCSTSTRVEVNDNHPKTFTSSLLESVTKTVPDDFDETPPCSQLTLLSKQQKIKSSENEENGLVSSSSKKNSEFRFGSDLTLETIRRQQAEFVEERNWNQFHSPRNLLLAMVGEVGEVSEIFQWRNEVQVGLPDWSEADVTHLSEELSDVLIYLIRLAEQCRIDLPAAVLRKIEINREKYPVGRVYGSSKKYSEYKDDQPHRRGAGGAATTDQGFMSDEQLAELLGTDPKSTSLNASGQSGSS